MTGGLSSKLSREVVDIAMYLYCLMKSSLTIKPSQNKVSIQCYRMSRGSEMSHGFLLGSRYTRCAPG